MGLFDTIKNSILGTDVTIASGSERVDENIREDRAAEDELHKRNINNLEKQFEERRNELEAKIEVEKQEAARLEGELTAATKDLKDGSDLSKDAQRKYLEEEAALKQKIAEENARVQEVYEEKLKEHKEAEKLGEPSVPPIKPEPLTLEDVKKYSEHPELEPDVRHPQHDQGKINDFIAAYSGEGYTDDDGRKYELAPLRKEVQESKDAFSEAKTAHTQAQKNLDGVQNGIKGMEAEIDTQNKAFIGELDRHSGKVAEINKRGGVNETERSKIEFLKEHYEKIIEEKVPPHYREEAREALGVAGQAKTAAKFLESIKSAETESKFAMSNGVARTFGSAVPEKLPPSDSKHTVVTLSEDKDGKLIATIAGKENDGKGKVVYLGESGVLDMEAYNGKTVQFRVEKNVQHEVTLLNTERVNVEFRGPRPGGDVNGPVQNNCCDPAKVIHVMNTDPAASQRLHNASAMAEAESQRRAMVEGLHAAKSVYKGQQEIAKMQAEGAKMGIDIDQFVAPTVGAAKAPAPATGRST